MATKRTGAAHTRVLADNEYIRQFHKLVDSFTSHNYWRVYTDFLQLTLDAFLSDHTPDHPREKHYMDIMRDYKGKEPRAFGEMLGCVMAYMQTTNRECLSEIWEEYAANANLGQFFTPWNICEFMARVALEAAEWDKYTPEKKCYISDPSCGGARTLIAALKKVPQEKLNAVCFHGIDIDGNVCIAAALNMLFFNANSYIVHGNALTLEVWHVYRTIHHWTGGTIIEITDPEEMKRIIEMGLHGHREEVEQQRREKAAKRPAEAAETVKPVNDTGKAESPAKTPKTDKISENANIKSETPQQLFLF